MSKLSEDELLRQACIYAEQDRKSLIVAYDGMENDPVAKEAVRFVKQVRAYRLKRWGKTSLEVKIGQMVEKTIDEIIENLFSSGVCTIHYYNTPLRDAEFTFLS